MEGDTRLFYQASGQVSADTNRERARSGTSAQPLNHQSGRTETRKNESDCPVSSRAIRKDEHSAEKSHHLTHLVKLLLRVLLKRLLREYTEITNAAVALVPPIKQDLTLRMIPLGILLLARHRLAVPRDNWTRDFLTVHVAVHHRLRRPQPTSNYRQSMPLIGCRSRKATSAGTAIAGTWPLQDVWYWHWPSS